MIEKVEQLREIRYGTLMVNHDHSGWFIRAIDNYTDGVKLFGLDWFELDEAMDLFGPFNPVWGPDGFYYPEPV